MSLELPFPNPSWFPHRQILADFWLADPAMLRFVHPLWPVVRAAVEESGATLLTEQAHQFQPHGFTGFILLAQSHVSLHTWVEQRLLLLDIQACGPMRPGVILDRLRDYLRPTRFTIQRLERGRADEEMRR